MTTRSPRTAAALLAVTLALTAVGCGKEGGSSGGSGDAGDQSRTGTSSPADSEDPAVLESYANEVAALPGIRDAAIATERGVDEDVDDVYWHVVADAEEDATAVEIADVLDAIQNMHDNGAPAYHVDGAVYLAAGTTSWSEPWERRHTGVWTSSHFGAQAAADLLLRAVATFDDASVGIHAGGLSVSFGDGGLEQVTEAAKTLVADQELAPIEGVSVAAEGKPAGFLSTNEEPLSPAFVGAWEELAGTANQAGEANLVSITMAVNTTPSVITTTRVPGNVRPRMLTTENYGDVLWPLLRAQMDVLAADPELDSLRAVNLHDHTDDLYCSVYEDPAEPPDKRDVYGRTWEWEANQYLNP